MSLKVKAGEVSPFSQDQIPMRVFLDVAASLTSDRPYPTPLKKELLDLDVKMLLGGREGGSEADKSITAVMAAFEVDLLTMRITMHGVYTVVDTPCGKMFVGEIENALCAVSFNPDIDDAVRTLHFSYPLVHFTEGHVSSAENILRLLGGEGSIENIRISELVFMRCSEFQRKVYEQLVRIPRGGTKSYAEVAKSIGRPTAYRAVARACRDNVLAVVIPCHRVVASNGSLRGYRWGIEVKKKLLELERKY